MLKRILVSAVILPFFLGLLFKGNPVYFRLFIASALLMAFFEYRGVLEHRGLRISPWPGVIALFVTLMPTALKGVVPIEPFWLEGGTLSVLQALAIFFIVVAILVVAYADLEKGMIRFFAELAGPVYLGVLGVHVLLLHELTYGHWWVLLVFWYAWIYDSGALFIGKPFGKRPFSPLSPKKTWEGFWGGMAVTALLSGLVLPWLLPEDFPLRWPMLVALSVPACVLAQAGDLFESMLKRYGGVKDSSAIIPAQGGFLDKIDSSLFVAPFLYVVAKLLKVI